MQGASSRQRSGLASVPGVPAVACGQSGLADGCRSGVSAATEWLWSAGRLRRRWRTGCRDADSVDVGACDPAKACVHRRWRFNRVPHRPASRSQPVRWAAAILRACCDPSCTECRHVASSFFPFRTSRPARAAPGTANRPGRVGPGAGLAGCAWHQRVDWLVAAVAGRHADAGVVEPVPVCLAHPGRTRCAPWCAPSAWPAGTAPPQCFAYGDTGACSLTFGRVGRRGVVLRSGHFFVRKHSCPSSPRSAWLPA